MQFTLRHAAIFFVVASVAFAFWASIRRIRELEGENLSLRDEIGYQRKYCDEDYYQLTSFGDDIGEDQRLIGSHLIRVANHEKYSLEIIFYDGSTKKKTTQIVEFGEPMLAVTYLPHPRYKRFQIRSTCLTNEHTHLPFEVDAHDYVSHFEPWGYVGPVSDECILYYLFRPELPLASGPVGGELRPSTPDKMCAVCDKYGLQAALFRIVERDVD